MADEDVVKAVENLRQVLQDNGMDEGTANAITSAALPSQPCVMGNLADLQRLGALLVQHEVAPTTALNEAFVAPPGPALPDTGTGAGAVSPEVASAQMEALKGDTAPLASSPDLGAMTKQQLQDYADDEGIDGVDLGMTKADMIAAIEAGG